jgi:hypothetical protein
MVRIKASQDGAPRLVNQPRRGDAVMASTMARSTGDRMSLVARMNNIRIAMPAKTTTDLTNGTAGFSEFMFAPPEFVRDLGNAIPTV